MDMKNQMKFLILSGMLLIASVLAVPATYGDDARANEAFAEARTAEKAGDFSGAAKSFKAAQIYADDPVLKANALLGASRAYRKEKLYGEEFDCLERLAKEHISRVNFTQVVDRQYEIADAYFAGHRDSAFSWLPFLKKENRCIEIYEAALKNAPCSEKAPDARLRLGRLYLEDQRAAEAIEQFKETVKLYPGTEAARCASLELANTYLQLSRKGDGDGSYARLALDALTDFLNRYPKDPEAPWARRSREEVHSLLAKRLYGLGLYYHRMGKDEIAERYLAKVVRDYANSVDSADSEKLLAKIDKTYEPPSGDVPRREHETPVYQRSPIPPEQSRIMVVPENSGGKWLLPVRDLRSDLRRDSREPLPERPFDDDAI